MNKKIIAIIIGLIVIFGSIIVVINTNYDNDLTIDKENEESEKKSHDILENITSFDEAVNAFAFDFYKEITKESNNENLFYSPYSIFTALAMVYEGARGDTESEMKNVLHVMQDNESFHKYMKSLYEYLNENSEYNVSTANALWPRIGYDLLDDYTDIIETYYGGKSQSVDYSRPSFASEIINNWVENQTNNLIKDLVPESAIDPYLTMLILTNAIYFKGSWLVEFADENTTMRDFTKINDKVISVETMKITNTQDKFNYTKTDELQMIEIPYNGNEISMYILLPNDGYSVNDISEIIDNNNLNSWLGSMYETELDLYLPKFKFETSYNLNDCLKKLGMESAFNSNANFSGIDGTDNLFISDVLHKAFIEVNEEGTEAAAATAIIMTFTSANGDGPPPRIEFDCDHPFTFIIMHKQTNTILFMGDIMEPVIEE